MKRTKKEWFNILRELAIESDRFDKKDLVKFIDRQLELLQEKVEKEKIRVSKKRVKTEDILKDRVFNAITDYYQSLEEIYLEVLIANADIEDLSKEKIVPRLTKLIQEGLVEKTKAKDIETNKRIVVYRLKQEEEENEVLHRI